MKSEYIIVLFLKDTNLPLKTSVSEKLLSVQLICSYRCEFLVKGTHNFYAFSRYKAYILTRIIYILMMTYILTEFLPYHFNSYFLPTLLPT